MGYVRSKIDDFLWVSRVLLGRAGGSSEERGVEAWRGVHGKK